MSRLGTFLTILTLGFVSMSFAAEQEKSTPEALKFTVKDIKGKDVDLSKYQGKVVLVVNVASECGLTPHYEGLEKLHEKYADKGLAVLGFPCNQFGGQEPKGEDDILKFCTDNYKVKFDMFSKVDVNGAKQAPLFKYLEAQEVQPKGKGDVSWNFEKFVIDRNGKVIARFKPQTDPSDAALVKVIEDALTAK